MPEPETNSAPSDPAADPSDPEVGPEEPDSTASQAFDPGGALQIDLSVEAKIDDALVPWLLEQAHAVAAAAELDHAALSIVIVHDPQMAALHEQYSNVPGTTDVLTFDLGESLGDRMIEGEIIICIDQAQRQSAARGHELRHELLLYIVHGILHLLGEDDHDPVAYEQMHAREDEILTAIGLGPIFARGEQAS